MIIGIDPGLDGGIAILEGPKALTVHDIPTLKERTRGREVDWAALSRLYMQYDIFEIEHAFIEQVHSMPKQGVASSFKFGYVAGGLRGLVAAWGIPTTMVTPQRWKKGLKLARTKDAAVARASELWPKVNFHGPKGGLRDGVAEAALIAYYGWKELHNAD